MGGLELLVPPFDLWGGGRAGDGKGHQPCQYNEASLKTRKGQSGELLGG